MHFPSAETVFHALTAAFQAATAVLSAYAAWTARQAKQTAGQATVDARNASREQITFALKRAVRSGLVGPAEAQYITGKDAPEEGAGHD